MANQQGNSGRGTNQLDQAAQNRALGIEEGVDIADRDEGRTAPVLASGDDGSMADDTSGYVADAQSEDEPLLPEGEEVGPWDPGQSDGKPGYDANAGGQPGGGRSSESERTD